MNDDPLVMYLIVRDSLHMSDGKIAAQCSHASNGQLLRYFKAQLLRAKCVKCGEKFPAEEEEHIRLTTLWIANDPTILVKVANESKWKQVLDENRDAYVVRDKGLTEVPENSLTVAALPVRYKSTVSDLIRKLPLL